MSDLQTGRYRIGLAEGADDLAAILALRARAFGTTAAGQPDAFDARCAQVTITRRDSGDLVAAFRLLSLAGGGNIHRSYAAQYYDLSKLCKFRGPILELGRFCIEPGLADADVLRLAWAALTARVDATGAKLLFGCASFPGIDPAPYADAFRYLARHHRAPARWLPAERAPLVHRYAGAPGIDGPAPDALAQMPPLLRSYLRMGGWVSDHAVIDRAMQTCHVFTGVEIAGIPAARQRLLRADAAACAGAVLAAGD